MEQQLSELKQRLPRLRKFWKRSRKIDTIKRLEIERLEIPVDWQNTLTNRYPTLRRSSSSVTSVATSTSSCSSSSSISSSSLASSYSVSDFLRDLTDPGSYTPHPEKTSTPLPRQTARHCASTPLPRQNSLLDLSGVRIYEEDTELREEEPRKESVLLLLTQHSAVYENTEFLQAINVDQFNAEKFDEDENVYEVVTVREDQRKLQLRTLKSARR